ncbi:MAG: tRNA lysidine(34) synthetase TilS [Epulopiscium sp. Nuni2H_MBin003]|nr:MAG: tRNA lysidine(34) synthetase TilS [Epulopiscium sp. Nuni2H_MBin003]
MHIEEKIYTYITTNNLIPKNCEVIVGVSGGADSMMLLYYLAKYKERFKIKLRVAHINHMMRQEASSDMEFVRQTCKNLGVEFNSLESDVEKIARAKKISSEECGRQIRYEFFNSLANTPTTKIATAHNANDQVETMLMRFLRGTDVRGLRGILEKRDNIIRPILCLSRDEIEFYCKQYNIEYKTDSTNMLSIYTRNKLRLDVLPYISKHINKNIVHTLLEHRELYKEEEEFLQSYIDICIAKYVTYDSSSYNIDLIAFNLEKTYIQKKLILEVLVKLIGTSYNISTKHVNIAIQFVNSASSGKKLDFPAEILLIKTSHSLVFTNKHIAPITTCSLQLGDNIFKDYTITLTKLKNISKTLLKPHENVYTKYIDYDKIKNGLQIRSKLEGDTIKTPNGTQKIKKIFINNKIPLHKKSQIPLIVDENNVIYIVGYMINCDYYINNQTKNVLEIKYKSHTP